MTIRTFYGITEIDTVIYDPSGGINIIDDNTIGTLSVSRKSLKECFHFNSETADKILTELYETGKVDLRKYQ